MARVIGFVLLGLLVLATAGWALLAVTFAGPQGQFLRIGLSAAYAAIALLAVLGLFSQRWRWRLFGVYLVLFAATLTWWSSIVPSNDRDWQPDVAVLPYATMEGDAITVHNIRNFDYRSEFDYTPNYYDRKFDLQQLQGVDVVAVYWMGPAIAHVFLSFDFGNDSHLAVSIETRKEKGEEYSTIKGFFRQYEVYYVVADERDVIGLRTNYRNDPVEDVYIYRTAGDIANARRLFMEYIRQINALKTQPEFYNTLTTNCTTSIWLNTRVNAQHVPLSWKILVSGYLPEFLYEQGRLVNDGLDFKSLQRRAFVNTRAKKAGITADFSQRIRDYEAAE